MFGLRVIAVASFCAGAAIPAIAASTLTMLYSFGGRPDARNPSANLAIDQAGNLYGAGNGGANNAGAVFELSPPASGEGAWTETVLYSEPSDNAALGLAGGVIRDRAGDLFGTATSGGIGCGTVFELRNTSTDWKPAILHQFGADNGDGCEPSAALNMDASGALYGNTLGGGSNNNGTVFRISPPAPGSSQWTTSTIWSFDDKDGAYPSTQMIFDSAGNLYGTTNGGGAYGYGTVWELSPPANNATAWTITVLWSFHTSDCRNLTRGPLARDTAGNLYGTCDEGGRSNDGTVFELSPPTSAYGSWTLKTLWTFTGGLDGSHPTSGVVLSKLGDLFGVNRNGDSKSGKGTVFVLHPPTARRTAWTLQTLWQFNGSDGSGPQAPVLREKLGVIYGSTSSGGANGNGTVWELKP